MTYNCKINSKRILVPVSPYCCANPIDAEIHKKGISDTLLSSLRAPRCLAAAAAAADDRDPQKKISANDPPPPAGQCSPPQVAPAASAAAIKISICSHNHKMSIPMLLSRLQSFIRSYQWLDQTNTLFLQLPTPTISLGVIFFPGARTFLIQTTRCHLFYGFVQH